MGLSSNEFWAGQFFAALPISLVEGVLAAAVLIFHEERYKPSRNVTVYKGDNLQMSLALSNSTTAAPQPPPKDQQQKFIRVYTHVPRVTRYLENADASLVAATFAIFALCHTLLALLIACVFPFGRWAMVIGFAVYFMLPSVDGDKLGLIFGTSLFGYLTGSRNEKLRTAFYPSVALSNAMKIIGIFDDFERKARVLFYTTNPSSSQAFADTFWRNSFHARKGSFRAHRHGPHCTQPSAKPPENVSEDCLTLSIWTPFICQSEEALKTVVVVVSSDWFQKGHASDHEGAWEEIASLDVVVVAINFRLGVFGFLRAAPSENVPANVGFRDIIAALTWIRTSIAAFYGDRNAMVALGLGSGGVLLSLDLLSPNFGMIGFFRRLILHGMVAGSLMPRNSVDNMRALASSLNECSGFTLNLTALLVCLRNTNAPLYFPPANARSHFASCQAWTRTSRPNGHHKPLQPRGARFQ
ncbi:hypothetical protein V5799_005986 [Amblyomma americanum]|uniref:Carboxylesterase type B domain-containing protein n=1 Tax=Amblyomma americanum TaxID=6943 RepID=A0AAQ4DXP7_AMBAM